jgi:hypothetical protein
MTVTEAEGGREAKPRRGAHRLALLDTRPSDLRSARNAIGPSLSTSDPRPASDVYASTADNRISHRRWYPAPLRPRTSSRLPGKPVSLAAQPSLSIGQARRSNSGGPTQHGQPRRPSLPRPARRSSPAEHTRSLPSAADERPARVRPRLLVLPARPCDPARVDRCHGRGARRERIHGASGPLSRTYLTNRTLNKTMYREPAAARPSLLPKPAGRARHRLRLARRPPPLVDAQTSPIARPTAPPALSHRPLVPCPCRLGARPPSHVPRPHAPARTLSFGAADQQPQPGRARLQLRRRRR